MALFKYGDYVTNSVNAAFDDVHEPGAPAPHCGIYHCVSCGDEITVAKGDALPGPDHHPHKLGRDPIQWRLLVYADHRE